MEIHYETTSMQRACSREKDMQRRWGNRIAAKLMQRLAELSAAGALADMRALPAARCHELKAEWQGCLAVDLVHPHRLVFRPNYDPVPRTADGGLNWAAVTAIVVVEVVDYH
jgi:proteic killer suppression protein